jgi:surface antigen
MKNMFVVGAIALLTACTVNYTPVKGDVPDYNPQLPDPVYQPEVPKVSKPVVKIDKEVTKPRYHRGPGIGGEIAETFFNTARIVFERSDYEHIEQAANEAITVRSTGEAVEWQNAQSGRSGHVKVLKSLNKDGRYCRQFESEVVMNGGSVVMDNFACKDPRGNWFLLDK